MTKVENEIRTQEATPLEAELVELAASDTGRFFFAFRRVRESSAREVTRACLKHLGRHGADASWQKMQYWMVGTAHYVGPLLEARFLEHDEAARAAIVLRDADPQFFLKFQKGLTDTKLPASVPLLERALHVCKETGISEVLLPWLRGLSSHADEFLRAKAAKALCEIRPNLAAVERQMKSPDVRVRANALEALWTSTDPAAARLFRDALTDTSHRVVVNALIGMHRLRVPGAMQQLLALGDAPAPMMRRAAIWGMQFLGDARAVPVLRKLSKDESPDVAAKALMALSAMGADPHEGDFVERAEFEDAKVSAHPAPVPPEPPVQPQPKRSGAMFGVLNI